MNSRIHPFVPFTVIAAGLLFQALVWFVWYPLVGYGDVTQRIAQLAFAVLGLVLIFGLRLHRHRIGLGQTDLLWAVLGSAVARCYQSSRSRLVAHVDHSRARLVDRS